MTTAPKPATSHPRLSPSARRSVDQATVKQVPGEKTPTTRIDQSRVRVTMTKVDGKWLVSELAAL